MFQNTAMFSGQRSALCILQANYAPSLLTAASSPVGHTCSALGAGMRGVCVCVCVCVCCSSLSPSFSLPLSLSLPLSAKIFLSFQVHVFELQWIFNAASFKKPIWFNHLWACLSQLELRNAVP
jgi:hypothetical protein